MAKIALYRKYRPENFDQAIGQEHVSLILKNAILENKLSHAYLFTGPRGTGKTSFARILAKLINCESRNDYNPCGKCAICVGMTENRILDLIEIDAASNRGIDEIRDLREKAKFSPTECSHKVFIIDEVHMLTKEAFNALLKTLEEPPEHAIFILATTEINRVPTTIISRCQRHDFRRIKNTDIFTKLSEIKKAEKIKISDEALEIIAEASEGGLRDAISLLDQLASTGISSIEEQDVENIIGLASHKLVSGFVTELIKKNKNEALAILEKTASNGSDLIIFSKSCQAFLRKLIMSKVGAEDLLEGTVEQIDEIKSTSALADRDFLIKLLDAFFWAQGIFKTGVDPAMVLTIICARDYDIAESVASPYPKQEAATAVKTAGSQTKNGTVKKEKVAANGNWQHVLMEIKQKNNTIHAVLRVAHPVFEDSVLVLNFPYKFHKERIEERKNKELIESIVSKIYGQEIEIRCDLSTTGGNKEVDSVSDAVDILGGEIVN